MSKKEIAPVGFLALLTDEQKAAWLAYEGDDTLGSFSPETEAHFAVMNGKGQQTKETNTVVEKMAATSPTIRTSAGLRDALFDELDSLRNGTTNPAKANAVAKLADRTAAHQCIRDATDLIAALNEAAAFPGVVTDTDREVLVFRLRALNNACAPLLRMQPVTVGGRTNPTGGAA